MTVEELNGNRHIPFAQLVKEAASVGAPRETLLDGKQVIAVDLALDRPGITKGPWKLTAYFDPAVNWMIVGTDLSANPTKDRRILRKARVREMREVKPGVFFPLKGDHVVQINDGPVQMLWTSTISNLRINERIPESTFTLRYPDGLRVLDHTQNAMYNVNSRGERITPLQLLHSGDISSERTGLDVIGAPSSAEPPSRTRWLLGAGLGLIVLGLSLKVVRNYRRRTAAGSSVS